MHRPPQVRVSGTPARQPWPGPASGHRARSRVRRPAPRASLRSTAGGGRREDRRVRSHHDADEQGRREVRQGVAARHHQGRRDRTHRHHRGRAGARVPVWTDAAGDVVEPPLTEREIRRRTAGAGICAAVAVVVLGRLVYTAGARAVRRRRRRIEVWGRERERVGGRWTSRPSGDGGPAAPAAPGSPGGGRRRKKIPRRGTRIPIPPSFRSEAARRTPPAPRGLRHGRGAAGRRPRARLMPSAARRTVGVSAGTEASARGTTTGTAAVTPRPGCVQGPPPTPRPP
ncbi:hypothetical protein QFZ64_005945 [Streptomyces sp. B3I8]|nr:hypothetical protein [Streptomyces sp. B3I8]